MKPRHPLKAKLLPLMQATPSGARIEEYAKQIGYSRSETGKAAVDLHGHGLVAFCQNGMNKLWTAAEHYPALAFWCREENAARQMARREREREKNAARRPQENARKAISARKRYAQKKAARYPWPAYSAYQDPVKPICSVWDLACT